MIRALARQDIDPFMRHLIRHLAESGRDGERVFHPLAANPLRNDDETRRQVLSRWDLPLSQPGWERCWGYFDESGAILGHLDLRTDSLESKLHRARLGIGVERQARGQGVARSLMTQAVSWAREQRLGWIDLGVFAENEPAIALYRSVGFREVARVEDQFRLAGVSITDLWMALKL
jgi:RimJ/RimL family protein N-acetyltransferase